MLPNRFSIGPVDPQTAQLLWTLAQITTLWTASDVGYYFLLPALGVQSSYNGGSIAITLYYVFWVGIAVITFWQVYAKWPLYAKWVTFENRLTSYVVWSLAFTGCILFAAYLLPALPPFTWNQTWNPPDLALATPSYFLPKSIEILFQQLLIIALVLSLSALQCSLRRISVYCAVLFGAAHILLAFGGVPWGYVVRFATLATLFGFAFPYLILRVPNGFAYSYVTHWGYYAITLVMARLLGSGTIIDFAKRMLGGS